MELERYLDQTIEEFRKKFGVSNEFQSALKEDTALRNAELSDGPSGRLGDDYIRAMELAGFEFVEATDLCYFKDKVSERILGLDYEPCIYDHLQEMDLPEDTRERIERILPKAEWKIVKPVFDKEYLHFELELKEHGIVSHLPGTYKLQDSSEPRMHIQSETFEQDMGVLYRDFDRMERCLKEIVLEKEKVRELAEDLMKKSEFHKEDSEAIEKVFENKTPGMRLDFSHKTFYDVILPENLEGIDISESKFVNCIYNGLDFQGQIPAQGIVRKSEIAEAVKAAGFKPTKSLVDNIAKFNQLSWKNYSLKELAQLRRTNPELKGNEKACMEGIVEECQVQEQKQHKSHFARQEMQMEMNPVNWVQTM